MKFRGIVTFSTLLFCSGFVAWRIKKNRAQQAITLSLVVTPQFSKKMHDELNLFAKQQEKEWHGAHSFLQELKQQFGAVGSVSLWKKSGKKVVVKISHKEPLVGFGDTFFLTQTYDVIPKNCYKDEYEKHLPTIAFTQKDKEVVDVSSLFKTFVAKTDKNIYKDYAVTWHDGSHVQLQDKQDPQFTLLASGSTQLDSELLADYKRLKQKVKERNTKGTKKWCFDVRFKNQIILFPGKGAS